MKCVRKKKRKQPDSLLVPCPADWGGRSDFSLKTFGAFEHGIGRVVMEIGASCDGDWSKL